MAELAQEVGIVPAKWPLMRLDHIAELSLGKMLDKEKNKGELRPYLANMNVRWGSFNLQDLREMRFEEREFERYGLRFGDIVMCEGGEPGRCAIWTDEVPGMMIQKALHRIRPMEGIDSRYLYYALAYSGQSGAFDEYMTGSGIKHLPGNQVAKVEVSIPPLDEQRRIAEVLRSVDEAIAATQDIVEAGASVRQVALDVMVQRVLDDPETKVRPLSDIAEVRTGLAKNKNRAGPRVNVPYLRVANVQDGWFDLTDIQDIEVDPGQVDRYLLQAGDVLLTEGGDYDKLGRGGVWHGQIAPCLHQNHVFCVRPDTSALLSDYFALATQSAWGRAYFLTCAKRTTNLASINSSQLRAFPVPVVPRRAQALLIAEVSAIDAMIDLEERQLETLLRLRAEVSSDLLSGRVRVPT